MGFFIKLLISVLIVAVFIAPVVDWSRDSAWSAFFFPMLAFP